MWLQLHLFQSIDVFTPHCPACTLLSINELVIFSHLMWRCCLISVKANAEADSFSCFVRLLGDSVDHFCQQLDNSSVGILSTLSRLSELLKTNDEELWRHLEFTTRVEPQFYAFRWITLLLTQEFSFQSILRIWDSLLGNPFGVQDMLLRVCCAMLLCIKSRLMSGDFIANLKLLQHYPDINIEHLLQVAMDLTPDTSSYRLSL